MYSSSTPFKGLQPFSEADRGLFFGRQELTDLVSANVEAWRLTLLYGGSGVGKTSLLHAAVLPCLKEMSGVTVVEFSDWRRPDVMMALKEKLTAAAREKTEDSIDNRLDFPQVVLKACGQGTDGLIILIFDQFEEYFHHHEDDEEFIKELARAIQYAGQQVRVLISIREESLARLDRLRNQLPQLFDHLVRIRPLTETEATAAIVEPVKQHNQRSLDHHMDLEPELIHAVLSEVGTGTGKAINASLLQLVMMRLWDEETKRGSNVLRLSTYDQLGRAEAITSGALDSALSSLTQHERSLAPQIFRYLVTASGAKLSQSAADLASYTGLPVGEITKLLDRFSQKDTPILRSLRSLDNDDEPRYEIFHELLASSVLAEVQGWEEEQRKIDAARQRRVQRAHYARIGSAVMAVLLVIMAGLTLYAWGQNKQLAWTYNKLNQTYDALMEKSASLVSSERETYTKNQQLIQKNQELQRSYETVSKEKLRADEATQRAVEATKIAQSETARAEKALNAAKEANTKLQSTIGERDRAIADKEKEREIAQEARNEAERARAKAEAARDEAEVASKAAEKARKEAEAARDEAKANLVRRDAALTSLEKTDDAAVYSWALLRPGKSINRVSVSDDNSNLTISGADGTSQTLDADVLSKHYVDRAEPSPTPKQTVVPSPTPKFVSGVAAESEAVMVKINHKRVRPVDGDYKATEIPPKRAGINHIADVSGDQHFAATISSDGKAQIWDCPTASGCPSRVLRHENGVKVNSIRFDIEGKRAVTASSDGMARVWNVQTGDVLRTLRDTKGLLIRTLHEPHRTFLKNFFAGITSIRFIRYKPQVAPLNSAAFSPVGNFVVTGGDDYTVKVWDVQNGSPVRVLRGHTAVVRFVDFNAYGNHVISTGDDQTVRVWQPCDDQNKDDQNKKASQNKAGNAEVTTKTGRRRFVEYCQEVASKPRLPKIN